MENTNKNTSEGISLASAAGKRFKRKVWNIYKDTKTGKHYYQVQPYNENDTIIEPRINPDRGSELVNKYNEEDEKDA